MKRLRKPRFLFIYPIAIALGLLGHTTEWGFRLGIGILLLAVLLRLWANGHVGHRKVNWTPPGSAGGKIGCLITAGPYAYVRNPLYFGSLLIIAGFCVMLGSIWLGLVGLACFLFIYRTKILEEEHTLRHEWGSAFERYVASVPRLWPTWRRNPHREGQWSWQGLRASKELKTMGWVSVGIILCYFREEIIQEGESLLGEDVLKHTIWFVVLGLIVLIDAAYELVKRSRRRSAPVAVPHL